MKDSGLNAWDIGMAVATIGGLACSIAGIVCNYKGNQVRGNQLNSLLTGGQQTQQNLPHQQSK